MDEPKGHVLLVEDDAELLRAYERQLNVAGYLVDTAASGTDAVARLKGSNFDAIVSDLAMPGLDGIDLLREVRAIDLDLPVLLVTANPTIHSAAAAVQHGAFRYLLKPFPLGTLVREVERAVRLFGWAKLRRTAHLGEDAMHTTDRAGLDAMFGRALAGLWMAYQPIVSFSERRVFAYEALMRTSDTSLPLPGAILRAAERLDRCEELGRRVRSLVSSELATSMEGTVFVNLHARDLLDASLYAADAPLSQHARRVVLEITERAGLDAVDALPARTARLRELGFRIAVDDLGAGFAGLTSFAQLEPDIVKVDMSLVRDIDKSPTKRRLVAALVPLCRDMGTTLIVEGVETAEERDTLVELGCELLQGYLFARPAKPPPPVSWDR